MPIEHAQRGEWFLISSVTALCYHSRRDPDVAGHALRAKSRWKTTPRGVTQKSACMTLVTRAQYGGNNGVETQISLGIAIHVKSNLQYHHLQFHSVVYSIFSLKYSIVLKTHRRLPSDHALCLVHPATSKLLATPVFVLQAKTHISSPFPSI